MTKKNTFNDDQVLEQVDVWLDAGTKVALATVVKTWGSAPRPVGSQLAVCGDGKFIGSVSGGCIEGAVIHAGQDVIESGQTTRLEYGVSDTQAWEQGLACGGKIEIYLEPVSP